MAAPMSRKVDRLTDSVVSPTKDISQHYRKLANAVSLKCPTLAKFYLNKSRLSKKAAQDDKKYIFSRCSFCLNTFSASNNTIKLLSKPALNKKIKGLLHRQTTSPASLGKFQTKLVQDYVDGKNTLSVRCHVCKKKRKFVGQTRAEKYAQKEYQEKQAFQKMPTEDVKTSTRKEKRKERRKLMRKKRAAGETEEDTNAGLTLPETSKMVFGDDLVHVRTGQDKEEDIFQDTSEMKKESQTLIRSDVLDRFRGRSAGDKSVVASVKDHNTVLNKSTSQQKQLNIHLADKQRTIALPQTVNVNKSSNKKSKSKKMSKQLGNMLKKEQNKQTGGTLTDFLSSL